MLIFRIRSLLYSWKRVYNRDEKNCISTIDEDVELNHEYTYRVQGTPTSYNFLINFILSILSRDDDTIEKE